MSTILKNVLQFSNLVVGVPASLPHLLNINNVYPVIPQLVAADAPNFTISADDLNITVTRTAAGGASVKVYVEHWHTIEEVFPKPPTTVGLVPFIIASGDGGSGTINVIEDENVPVAGAPHSILNFTGAGVLASNAGGGQVDITIPATISTIEDENVAVAGAPHSTLNFTGAGIAATNAGGGQANVTVNATIATIEDENVAVAGAPHTILNFTGEGVTASDAGGGQVNVTIPGGGLAQNAAMFYGTTTGTGSEGNDYAATVAVQTVAGTGRVPFPRNGPTVGAPAVRDGVEPDEFVCAAAGVYEVSWNIEIVEASQLQLAIDDVGAATTTSFSGAGTQLNQNKVLVTLTAGQKLSLINPPGNAAALTIQPADGTHTHAQAPNLIIKRIS
jgi:hypothetical protein